MFSPITSQKFNTLEYRKLWYSYPCHVQELFNSVSCSTKKYHYVCRDRSTFCHQCLEKILTSWDDDYFLKFYLQCDVTIFLLASINSFDRREPRNSPWFTFHHLWYEITNHLVERVIHPQLGHNLLETSCILEVHEMFWKRWPISVLIRLY